MSERLTFIDGCGNADLVACKKCGSGCGPDNENCGNCDSPLIAYAKLADYEDTGLTPERTAELAAADKEGRVVVLPCKVGDTVYYIQNKLVHPLVINRITLTSDGLIMFDIFKYQRASIDGFEMACIDRDVFLTLEAAEVTLTAQKGGEDA